MSSTDSTSTVSSESTETTTTTSSLALDGDVKIAGVLEVEIDVEYKLEQEVVEDMFKRALAASLDVPLINVLKTTATEMSTVPASRRLQSLNTTRYEVAYEVIFLFGFVEVPLRSLAMLVAYACGAILLLTASA